MKSFKSTLRRFAEDESATVTTEFIIVMPMLVMWWIGSIVFFDAFDARAGASRVSHTIADNISRQVSTSAAMIDDLLVLQNRMLPNDPVGYVRITQIQKDALGNLVIEWSYSTDGAALTDIVEIPTAIMPPMGNGQRILLVDTAVPYIPIAKIVGITAQTWVNRVYTNARFVDNIPFVIP